MKRLYLSLFILILTATLVQAQQTKIFPDSLGSHWVFTLTGGSSPSPGVYCWGSPPPVDCYWLERDTLISGKKYLRMAYQRGSFEGKGSLFYWLRVDNTARRLYMLDSINQEQLLFDYTLAIGDSTPVLYSQSIFIPSNARYYKAKVEAITPFSFSGHNYQNWFLTTGNRGIIVGEGIGGMESYTPLTFDPWQSLEGLYLTCFNGRNFGSLRMSSYCGCNTVAPPIIAAISQKQLVASIWAFPNPASSTLTLEGLPAGQTIQLYNSEGRMVLNQILNKGNTINILHLPTGLYQWRCGAVSGRVAKE